MKLFLKYKNIMKKIMNKEIWDYIFLKLDQRWIIYYNILSVIISKNRIINDESLSLKEKDSSLFKSTANELSNFFNSIDIKKMLFLFVYCLAYAGQKNCY